MTMLRASRRHALEVWADCLATAPHIHDLRAMIARWLYLPVHVHSSTTARAQLSCRAGQKLAAPAVVGLFRGHEMFAGNSRCAYSVLHKYLD